ncbi:EamA/RhaT family transporter [Arcobacter venerupis]|uniref:EamA/RhaT family transporter n=1 Tax=Arcobacter venerupis TaxID=1054033 RepID=A0AAE7E2R4_9BACT|nr:DMT family transporter [Arcobacter venerupis]QKF66413.1 EamA/RhaT family transporter [Arcobacter venerupis]RWS50809.1 EamA family transporter [Arcobacter venerupis]
MNQTLNIKFILFLLLSLLFLALNSILCKFALSSNFIDAYTFTMFRLFFGSITLILIFFYKRKKIYFSKKSNWLSSLMLFLYAICFSYSFLNIDAGVGTLLLFAVVQLVMIIFSLFHKEKINLQKIAGIVLAMFGLVYLLYPKESFELSLFHAFLMIIAGISWAVYTVLGKKSSDSLYNTMDNFTKSLIFVGIFYILFLPENTFITQKGLILAFISGSLTSAIGYLLWYEILPKMQFITAGIIQLFVPIISIIISIIFLNESLTSTLFLSTMMIFMGILLTIFSRKLNK